MAGYIRQSCIHFLLLSLHSIPSISIESLHLTIVTKDWLAWVLLFDCAYHVIVKLAMSFPSNSRVDCTVAYFQFPRELCNLPLQAEATQMNRSSQCSEYRDRHVLLVVANLSL